MVELLLTFYPDSFNKTLKYIQDIHRLVVTPLYLYNIIIIIRIYGPVNHIIMYPTEHSTCMYPCMHMVSSIYVTLFY